MVRLADQIAYINHDIEDALRGGVIYPIDIPLEVSQVLGFTHGERINALVRGRHLRPAGGRTASVSPRRWGRPWQVLKEFMFANVYTNPMAKGEEGKAQDMLQMLFEYYQKNPDELPADFQAIRLEEGVDRAVCDYIAGMTDPFAVSEYTRLFIPMGWTREVGRFCPEIGIKSRRIRAINSGRGRTNAHTGAVFGRADRPD